MIKELCTIFAFSNFSSVTLCQFCYKENQKQDRKVIFERTEDASWYSVYNSALLVTKAQRRL